MLFLTYAFAYDILINACIKLGVCKIAKINSKKM